MSIFLENIKLALDKELIDEGQAMYLIFTKEEIKYDIDAEDLFALTKLKYIVNGRIGKALLSQDSVIEPTISGTIKPLYFNDISAQIPKELLRRLANHDGKGNLILPGDDNSIKYTADQYLQNEGLVAFHFILLLFLFPVEGDTNKRWEKHFAGFKYKGARLRTRSKKTGRHFLKIVRKKDMGAFLYGTYLYIKSCIRENKAYVKTIPKYLDEYEDWYNEAYAIIKDTKDVQKLFKQDNAREGRLSIAI